jgi:ribosomal protein S18 acetylase RimI-like enzyme
MFTSALQDVFFVYEEKKILKRILGFLVARYSEGDNSIMIRKFAVHPHHRGKGIGTRLIAAVLDELRKMHVSEVNLHVHPSNTGAIRLYERLAFTIVKMERPDYGEDEDFCLMRLKLGSHVRA